MPAVYYVTFLEAEHVGLTTSTKQSSINLSVSDNLWHSLVGLNSHSNPYNARRWSQTPTRSFLRKKAGIVHIQYGCEALFKFF